MSGFIVLSRDIFDHHLFKDGERFRAFAWLISNACWKATPFDINGKTVTIERGQICTSRSILAREWNWSPSAVERFLTRLETEQVIGRATGQGRTIITICNYGKYQDISSEPGQATGQATGQRSDSDRTAKEPSNHLTKDSPNGESTPSISPSRSKSGSKKAQRQPSIPDWIPSEQWSAFLDMRRKKGATPTDRAVSLLIGKLSKLRDDGHDPGNVLDQSTLKNWTDVYPLKDDDYDRSKANRRNGSGSGRAGYTSRDDRDGFQRAIDDEMGRSGSHHSGQPAGQADRFDDGEGAGDSPRGSAEIIPLRS